MEETIFHRAHCFSNAAAREEYLNLACHGDETLRCRIESLLEAAEHIGGFMDTPAVNSIVADYVPQKSCQEPFPATAAVRVPDEIRESIPDNSSTPFSTPFDTSNDDATNSDSDVLIGQTLRHYRVDSLIGYGGMGRVYLAEDQRLGRKIALKVIAPSLMSEEKPRFLREAQFASALDHPNVCAIYDVGESSDYCFIAMQYIEGQTLEKAINGRPVAIDELLAISAQVADALSTAHQRGIIHRDLKPRNILVTARGQAVILDFGLAKYSASNESHVSQIEGVAGTPAFMSPEQARGEDVDCRSDVFSLGAVLYHMATGAIPFRGTSSADVMRAVISDPHAPPRERNPQLPYELSAVIDRALAKAPGERYQSVAEMASELRLIQTQLTLPSHPASLRARRQLRQTFAIAMVASVMVALGAFGWRSANLAWALQQVSTIEEFARAGRSFEAYDLANHVRKSLSGDAKLTRLLPVISSTLTVTSEPAGALVYLSPINPQPSGDSPPRTLAGITPLNDFEIARGDYLISVEKEGYVPFHRTYSDRTYLSVDAPIIYPSIPLEIELTPIADARKGMVFVPGGDYRLAAIRRPTDALVKLDDYWIDKYEVTNREYKEFVDADGYLNERYWMHEFVKNGRTLSRAEAMRELVDSTDKPGPRGWSNQAFPEGKAEHPVVGITWYEAAAYAAFRGKSLPTIFQWEYAARFRWTRGGVVEFNNPLGVTMPWGLHEGSTTDRANFRGAGTVPVGSFEYGMSPYGCYDMAGNVAEWCLNNTSSGFIASGGSWASIPSAWGYFGIYPAFRDADEVGFRCVVNSPSATGDQGANWINLQEEVPQFTPAPEAEVKSFCEDYYEYDKEAPLDARVIDRAESIAWWREKIEFTGADGERAHAYLYLPKHFPAPHQVIHILPAGAVTYRQRTVFEAIEADYASFVTSGRAVFAVVLRGYLGRDRPVGWVKPDSATIEHVNMMAEHVVDLRRGLDFLRSRDDLDPCRIAYMSASHEGILMALPATEPHYGAAIFVGNGVGKRDLRRHPAVSGINFAPLILAPKLLVHGRYDESAPLKTAAEPLYNLLTGEKEKIYFDCAHRVDPKDLVPTANQWLDGTFGPVLPVASK